MDGSGTGGGLGQELFPLKLVDTNCIRVNRGLCHFSQGNSLITPLYLAGKILFTAGLADGKRGGKGCVPTIFPDGERNQRSPRHTVSLATDSFTLAYGKDNSQAGQKRGISRLPLVSSYLTESLSILHYNSNNNHNGNSNSSTSRSAFSCIYDQEDFM